MAEIRVVIADDHPVVRAGVRDLLAAAEGITVVGEAADGEEALRQVEEQAPDVLLLDVEMPKRSGVEVARVLRDRAGATHLLALSSYDEQEYVQGLLKGGASGYLTKEQAPDLIVEAVRAVARGEVRWFVRPSVSSSEVPDLTDRERETLRRMAHGDSNSEIADTLNIAESTVQKHATKIYQKLNVDSGREAIAWAWQSGLMSGEVGAER